MSSTTAAPPIQHPGAAPTLQHQVAAWLRQLSYYASSEAAGRRDLRVDFLRGFCIFAMVVDHLGGDSWLYAITGGNRFYVSAAEGFIFISGVVMGQAYRLKSERSGLVSAQADALRRARTLYICTAVLTVVFSALYLYTDIVLWTGRDFGLGLDTLDEVIVGALTLHYTYHGTDILAMYALLILVAPLVFLLLALGQWRWVLLVSWLWWLGYQAYPELMAIPWYIRNGENFPLAAWQVLFITGQVIGFHRREIAAWLGPYRRLRVAVIGLCVAMVLALVALFWAQQTGLPAHLSFFDLDPDVLSETFFKVPLRPWRIVAFASTAIMAYTLVTYLWRPLRRGLGWLLLPLGQAALYCYVVHFFLILAVLNLVPLLTSREIPIEALNPVFQLAIVAVLWLMVRKRVLFGIVPN
jgi:hypothetical protein